MLTLKPNLCHWDTTLVVFGLHLCIFDPNTTLCNSYSSFFDEWILSVLGPWRSGSLGGGLFIGLWPLFWRHAEPEL